MIRDVFCTMILQTNNINQIINANGNQVEKESTNGQETKHKNTKNNCKQVPPVVLTSKCKKKEENLTKTH